MISLLTGLLYIELDYISDSEIVEQRLIKHAQPSTVVMESKYKVIPTVRSGLDELQQNVTELLADVSVVIKDLRTKLEQLEFDKLNTSLLSAAEGMDELLNAPEIDTALAKVNPMLEDIQKLFGQLNTEVNPIASEIKASLASMQGTLNNLGGMVDEKSALRYQLTGALSDLSDAAKAMALLADYLERNPNAILTGKAKKETK